MRGLVYLIAVAALAVLLLHSCSSQTAVVENLPNEAPQVWLTSGPAEGSVTGYNVTFFWGGSDPDGDVSHYEYIITDDDVMFDPGDTMTVGDDYLWQRVDGTDGTFMVSADRIPDSSAVDFEGSHKPEEFRRAHTFLIRAFDTQGSVSTNTVRRSFTARTLSPTVTIDSPRVPPPGEVNICPHISTFRWTGTDYVGDMITRQDPAATRYVMVSTFNHNDSYAEALNYIRNNPQAVEWSSWSDYDAPDNAGRQWTTLPLDFGRYVFAVQVMDEAGAVSPVFDLAQNARNILVPSDIWEPIVTVRLPDSTYTVTRPDNPPIIVDWPAGEALSLQFEVGVINDVHGRSYEYRHSSWGGVTTEWTLYVGPVSLTSPVLYFGTHSFLLEVRDNNGFLTRFDLRINVVPPAM